MASSSTDNTKIIDIPVSPMTEDDMLCIEDQFSKSSRSARLNKSRGESVKKMHRALGAEQLKKENRMLQEEKATTEEELASVVQVIDEWFPIWKRTVDVLEITLNENAALLRDVTKYQKEKKALIDRNMEGGKRLWSWVEKNEASLKMQDALQLRNEQLMADNQILMSENKDLITKIDAAKPDILALMQDKKELEARVKVLMIGIDTAESGNANLITGIETAKAKILALMLDKQDREAINEVDLLALAEHDEDLHAQIQALQGLNRMLQAENEVYSQTMAKADRDMNAMRETCAAVKNEALQLRKRSDQPMNLAATRLPQASTAEYYSDYSWRVLLFVLRRICLPMILVWFPLRVVLLYRLEVLSIEDFEEFFYFNLRDILCYVCPVVFFVWVTLRAILFFGLAH